MKVSELGEFGLIGILADIVGRGKERGVAPAEKLLTGIGDDAAVWQGENYLQLATTDSLVEGVHFDPGTVSWEEIGYKAIAVNLSDIAAMGGTPEYCLVSLALPGETDVDDVKQLYYGMSGIADQFGTAIAGGNVSSAREVMITVTIFGILKGSSALTRSGARVGDKIAITGYTGLSAAWVKMMKTVLPLDMESAALLRQAHLKPVPRIEEGRNLLKYGVKAAIDISDGLIADLTHICEASKVGAVLHEDLVPVHPVLETYFPDDRYQLVFTGGEDYELLFTAPDDIMKDVERNVSCPVHPVGEITGEVDEHVIIIDGKGSRVRFRKSGWAHF
jgi:thiamine-monophosphate kinase